jgi:hypothetical protein
MTKNSISAINFYSDQHRERKVIVQKNRMPIVRCVCGCEILVVPDLKAMKFAISNHMSEHRQAGYTPENISELLTEKILIAASKSNIN